jgi:hypothetical protein
MIHGSYESILLEGLIRIECQKNTCSNENEVKINIVERHRTRGAAFNSSTWSPSGETDVPAQCDPMYRCCDFHDNQVLTRADTSNIQHFLFIEKFSMAPCKIKFEDFAGPEETVLWHTGAAKRKVRDAGIEERWFSVCIDFSRHVFVLCAHAV